jgi:hypothetical protein
MYINFCMLIRFLYEPDISMSPHAGSLKSIRTPLSAHQPGLSLVARLLITRLAAPYHVRLTAGLLTFRERVFDPDISG